MDGWPIQGSSSPKILVGHPMPSLFFPTNPTCFYNESTRFRHAKMSFSNKKLLVKGCSYCNLKVALPTLSMIFITSTYLLPSSTIHFWHKFPTVPWRVERVNTSTSDAEFSRVRQRPVVHTNGHKYAHKWLWNEPSPIRNAHLKFGYVSKIEFTHHQKSV